MQSSRQGMRVGRAKFRAGDVDLAIHIWTKALESAYTAQDYAAMYVLSKNLGDAFTSLATEQQQQPLPKQKQRAATAVLEALQKSIDYYKYALNVIDECALLDVLGDERHLVLTRSAGHVHATLKRQEMTMEKLQKLPPATEEQPCTTCEELFEHLVLDDSDGCLYCQVCYDAFYASVEGVEFEHSFANREVLTAPPSELELAHELRAAAELSISDSSETKAEREDAIEEQSDGVANASSSSVTSEAANEDAEILSGLSTVSSATDSHSKAIKQTRTGEATAPLEQREPTTRARTTTPQVYSIPELLGLRTQSLVVRCPDAILSSPVARGVNSSTTSGSAKKPTDRKNSSTKQSKSSNKIKNTPTSPTRETHSLSGNLMSALPSVEPCNALRDAAAGTIAMADIQELAAALFDRSVNGQSSETGADGDAAFASNPPWKDGSFASDLALFATIWKQ